MKKIDDKITRPDLLGENRIVLNVGNELRSIVFNRLETHIFRTISNNYRMAMEKNIEL